MAAIQLFAQTARAGELNHRYIAPEGWPGDSAALKDLFDRAKDAGEGSDVLATKSDVSQITEGSRPGEETLLAFGEPVRRLDRGGRERLRGLLDEKRADLAELVTKKINWKEEGGEKLVVPRKEL